MAIAVPEGEEQRVMKGSETPFPDWIDPEWHNALFGCMRCMRACQENRPFLDSYFEGPSFNEATTQLLLAGAKKEDMPEDARPALEEWRLDLLAELVPRNLGALAKKERLRRAKQGCGKGETS